VTISHPTQLSDVTFRKTLANPSLGVARLDVTLTDVAPRLVRVVVDGFGGAVDPLRGTSTPAVILRSMPADPLAPPTFELSLKVVNSPADGLVLITAGNSVVSFTSCEFSANGGNGIVVGGDIRHVTVSGCNFSGNTLAGVRNVETFATVLATGNWWGDATGAAGPGGDGVDGLVDASSPLGQPVVLSY